MLHRITVLLIIGFWLGMTGLLVVREVYPEATRLNSIPMGHVGRILFQHEQSSDLVIRDKEKEIGFFHFQPRYNRDTRDRRIEFHGNVALNFPGAGRQRISWVGNAWLDEAFSVSRLRLTLSTHEPVQQVELDIDNVKNLTNYIISSNGAEIEKGKFTMDQNGVSSLLERAGLPVSIFKSLISQQASMPTPEVSARQATLKMSGESISTYVVSATLAGQPLMEAHFTQLGQILKAQAHSFGYKLLPYNVKESE